MTLNLFQFNELKKVRRTISSLYLSNNLRAFLYFLHFDILETPSSFRLFKNFLKVLLNLPHLKRFALTNFRTSMAKKVLFLK